MTRRIRRRIRLERTAKVCARPGCKRLVHPNRDSQFCDAMCAKFSREYEAKLERARISARSWIYRRRDADKR